MTTPVNEDTRTDESLVTVASDATAKGGSTPRRPHRRGGRNHRRRHNPWTTPTRRPLLPPPCLPVLRRALRYITPPPMTIPPFVWPASWRMALPPPPPLPPSALPPFNPPSTRIHKVDVGTDPIFSANTIRSTSIVRCTCNYRDMATSPISWPTDDTSTSDDDSMPSMSPTSSVSSSRLHSN